MKKEKWYSSPWTISLGTAIFSVFLTIIYDHSKKIEFFSTLYYILKKGYELIKFFLKIQIEIWLILLISFTIYVFFKIFIFFYSSKNNLPEFLNYKEDFLREWKWSWNWILNDFTNKWNVQNLSAHCPKCDTAMLTINHFMGTDFNCPRCDFTYNDLNNSKNLIKIESLILDNLKRNKL